MTVFEAFPNGLEAWKIAKMAYSTMTGNRYAAEITTINAIADEAQGEETPTSAGRPQEIRADTLIYCQPAELPTTSIPTLLTNYCVFDPDGRIYRITDAGRGKNQETGELEHIEIKLVQIEGTEESE